MRFLRKFWGILVLYLWFLSVFRGVRGCLGVVFRGFEGCWGFVAVVL